MNVAANLPMFRDKLLETFQYVSWKTNGGQKI
jgi:hypothetical protein